MLNQLSDKHPLSVAPLTLQHRMHGAIGQLCNDISYGGKHRHDRSRPGVFVDTFSINSRTAFHGNSQRAMMPPMLEGAHPGSIVRLFGLRHGHAPQQYRMGCHGQARSSDILLLYFHRQLSASLAGSQRAHCEVHTHWHLHAPCLVNRCCPAHQK
jgi:hypothetical protein